MFYSDSPCSVNSTVYLQNAHMEIQEVSKSRPTKLSCTSTADSVLSWMREEPNIKEGRAGEHGFCMVALKTISALPSFYGKCLDSLQSPKVLTMCQNANGNSRIKHAHQLGAFSVLTQKAR